MPHSDDLEVVKQIGSGGQGSCALVRRHKDHQLYVLKTMKHKDTYDGKAREAAILEDLPECNRICKYIASYIWPDRIGVLFEYCNAGDLHKIIESYGIEQRTIPEAFVWHVFIQLAEALAYIHYGYGRDEDNWTRIIHRDVKPQNVFLTFERSRSRHTAYPTIKLGDFGLAVDTSDEDYSPFTFSGTYIWQPPELPENTAKGDVWSLGAIIHAMAFDNQPPVDPLPKGVPNNHEMRQCWAQRSDARNPRDIGEVYSKLLAKWANTTLRIDPLKRITSLQLAKAMNKVAREQKHRNFVPLEPWALPSRYE